MTAWIVKRVVIAHVLCDDCGEAHVFDEWQAVEWVAQHVCKRRSVD